MGKRGGDMIEKLTKKQEAGITEWQQHCLKIGRDTSPINKPVVEKAWKEFYKILGKKEPKFWYCQSPLQAQIIINIFPEIQKIFSIEKGANIGANIWVNIGANIGANIWVNIGANIRDNIGDNIRANIGDNIGDNIRANIGDNIRANIRANIRDNIRANIGANIGDNIGANIRVNIRANIRDNIGDNIRANIKNLKMQWVDTYAWCQHDINWIAYYKYFEKYGLLPTDKNFKIFDIWYDLACSCGWCYTFENIVFVCEKPCKLSLNNVGRLHDTKSMALEYSDGYGLWMLNGIRVPQWLIETPAEKIEPKLALEEKNADVQREIIRKIGYDRMLQACNATTEETWDCPKTGLHYETKRMKYRT